MCSPIYCNCGIMYYTIVVIIRYYYSIVYVLIQYIVLIIYYIQYIQLPTCLVAKVMALVMEFLAPAWCSMSSANLSRLLRKAASLSTRLITCCCIVTDSMGYRPAALSPDSMMASELVGVVEYTGKHEYM